MSAYLIKNGIVLTGGEDRLLNSDDVLIEEGIITDIGNADSFELPQNCEVIDANGMVVMPAFYNMHVHLGESIFRGKCDGMDLWEYLDVSHDTYINPKWKQAEENIHRLSGLITVMECIESGTGYIVCNRGWRELCESKLQSSCLFPIVNISKLQDYYNNISDVKRISEEYEGKVSTSIFLQSLYLCDEEKLRTLKQIMDENREFNLFVHIAETVREQQYIQDEFGCTPIEALNRFGLLTDRSFCVHCIYLSDGDIELIKEKGAKVILCPTSNLKLNDGYPDVEKLIKKGMKLIVATDGFATNNSADLLEELKLIALLGHGKIPAKCLLDMITVNPAKAVSGSIPSGIIKKGYKTNISIFSTAKYNALDYESLISNLVYNHSSFDCRYVISGGRKILSEGEPVYINKRSIIEEYCNLYKDLYQTGDEE